MHFAISKMGRMHYHVGYANFDANLGFITLPRAAKPLFTKIDLIVAHSSAGAKESVRF